MESQAILQAKTQAKIVLLNWAPGSRHERGGSRGRSESRQAFEEQRPLRDQEEAQAAGSEAAPAAARRQERLVAPRGGG